MAALIVHGVFHRFPNLRVCSIENGSDWVAGLLSKLKKAERMNVRAFAESPVETFRQHVSVAPYYEEDVSALAGAIGVENVLLGSDFPHAEGLADPLSFLDELAEFAPDDVRLIMRENGQRLVQPRPASRA
jgi:predicted TIM-barrel fold metal-dependent hydrolase